MSPPRSTRSTTHGSDLTPVKARVSCTDPETHTIDVELSLPPLASSGHRELMMPRWIPGSYTLRDYARFVHSLEVTTKDGRSLPTTRPRPDRWRLRDPAKGKLTVRYQVYCRDLSVNTSHVTSTHLYLHGTTVFLYDEDSRDRPWHLELRVPKGWRIWTGLPEDPPRSGAWPPDIATKARFTADDYDHLIDCPLEAGADHHEERFTAAGKPHRLVTWNPPAGVDWKTITKDIAQIIEQACAIFDGPPYKDYTFILHVAREHGGGLEHDNSTVLGIDPLGLLEEKAYHTRFLPLIAHEYFHVWNVRRNKPVVLERIDYQRECPTGLLWFFEGGTTYYEFPLMLRAGIKKDRVYEVLAELVKAVESTPGRYRMSTEEASRLSWTKLYKQHESNLNTNISYYSKGALVCLLLDAHLRERGANLDQVMRHIWQHYGKNGQGIEEGSVARHVKQATGIDVARQLKSWVETPGDIPLDKALKALGLKIKREHSDPEKKKGLGVVLDQESLEVLAVADRWDTPTGKPRPGAQRVSSPVDPGDEILAVDGWKVTDKSLSRHLTNETDDVELTVFRDGRLKSFPMPLVEKTPDKIKIHEDKDASPEAKRARAGWKRKRAS